MSTPDGNGPDPQGQPATTSTGSRPPSLGHETLLALAATEPELLTAAIEASPVNITIADMSKPDMPLAYVNSAFTRTTGYSFEEVVGRNCRFLQGPDTDPAAIKLLRQSIETETEVEVEFVNYKKDGTAFINALKMAPVHDPHGQLISFVGIQTDVTKERERAKHEIDRQRIEALGQMAGGVAHQLNNLLQPIITLTSLHRPDMNDASMGADFDTILESARQASDVVGDILTFSRASDRKPAVHQVMDLVQKNIDFIRTMLPSKVVVRLTGVEKAASSRANLDATQFSQALANLLINASQAMNGSGEIVVHVEPGDTGYVEISVQDQGPGIPEEIRSKVLEPFFSTRLESGGTGLGLSVVYGIVKGIGGTLVITGVEKNRSGHGCCVTLSIPII